MLNASDDLHCDPSGNLIAVRESDVIVGLLQLPGRLLGPFDHGRWAGPRGVSVRDAFLSRTTDLKSVALDFKLIGTFSDRAKLHVAHSEDENWCREWVIRKGSHFSRFLVRHNYDTMLLLRDVASSVIS